MSEDGAVPAPANGVTIARLFGQCLILGSTTFGGGLLAQVRATFVEKTRWVSDQDFLESLSLTQALPGPNVVKLVVSLGYRLWGPPGALVGFLGVVVPGLIARVAVAIIVLVTAGNTVCIHLLLGMGAAAVGMAVCNAWTLGRAHLRGLVGIVIACATVVVGVLFHPPLLALVVVGGGLGVFLELRKPRLEDATP
ncbi:MAG: chromate transporter [Actinomycetes bacterium]